ncbi:cbb3-type cytochrome c oxidase subunit I [Flavobacterium sp. DGU11]|uniref:Cbb3-type cytochrome c oxidase subunit I n=1 Tax=Flavobacterium arundinis TaxID=3139143 RepID=A0ABU9HUK4_9FLAO
MKNKVSILFLATALLALLCGMLCGILAGLQYVIPGFIKEIMPFNNLRPMHVTSVISWIVLAATGGIYYYMSEIEGQELFSKLLVKAHFFIFIVTGCLIYYSYYTKTYGGKEYLEFPPYLILPVIAGWILFGISYFKTLSGKAKSWPVYFWMWGTGIVLMAYHLSEAYLWLHPSVGPDFIKALAIQWKAGGSFVGSWNMLVYGTAIFLMAKIKGDDSIGRNRIAFFFYFLGLTNLMFGWAHHIYIVPTSPWLRYSAYIISMTEWIILGSMIYQWRKSLPVELKIKNLMPYRFLMAADVWIFLNLILALLFSIPAINFFTHGTHTTVAHSMGTTIGINTTILMASLLYITKQVYPAVQNKLTVAGFKIFNVSLLLFWISLLVAGVKKSIWQYFEQTISFGAMQDQLYWVYIAFLIFGVGIFSGLSLIAYQLMKAFIFIIFKSKPQKVPDVAL